MIQIPPTLLALDFDGVLCDGLIEYFQTAWKAYCQLFQPVSETPPEGLAERFYALRPVIETGWEMPILLQAILTGWSDEAIIQNWSQEVRQIAQSAGVDPAAAAQTVDGVRDAWIRADASDWLAQHRFYPGTLERLQHAIAAGVYPIVISTKEGRFIRELLSQQGITLADAQILGKEVKQPKADTLRQLLQSPPPGLTDPVIWFVEDRLKALESVKRQPDLQSVSLFLADWGYNLEPDRQAAHRDDRIHLISLEQFASPFTQWC